MAENNMNKGADMSTALVILLVIIGVIFGIVLVAIKMLNNSGNKLSDMAVSMEESTFTSYDGQDVTGTQVVALTKQWADSGVFVAIKRKSDSTPMYLYYTPTGLTISGTDVTYTGTGAGTEETTNTPKIIKGLSVKSNSSYVNPNGKFTTSCVRDQNGTLVGVAFVQK